MRITVKLMLFTIICLNVMVNHAFAGTIPPYVLTGNPTNMGQSPLETKDFGNAVVGNTIAGTTETVTVVLNGGQSLGETVNISNISATGDFTVTGGSCVGATGLTANDTCTLNLSFTPTATGSRSGVLNVTCNVVMAAIGVIGLNCDNVSHVAYNLAGTGIMAAIAQAVPLMGREGFTLLILLMFAASLYALRRKQRS